MRADYHLHPNLHPKRPEKRLARLWKAIERHQLDAVVCAEHVFKDAPGAYRRFAAGKPKHLHCHVFPGAELVTRDGNAGVDVIAFAEHDWYDEHPRLLEPFTMTLRQMIGYLEASNLQWFIPHPVVITSPLKTLYPTQEEMQEFLAGVPAFEARNGCFVLTEHLCTFPVLHPFLRTFRNRLRESAEPVLQRYARETHQFFAVGSDAHHPREVGYSVEVPGKAGSRAHVFRLLTTNTDLTTLYLPSFTNPIPRLLHAAATTLREWRMRKAGMRTTEQDWEDVVEVETVPILSEVTEEVV